MFDSLYFIALKGALCSFQYANNCARNPVFDVIIARVLPVQIFVSLAFLLIRQQTKIGGHFLPLRQ